MAGTAGGARPPTEFKRGGRLRPAAETRSSRCKLLESGTKDGTEGTAGGTAGGPMDDPPRRVMPLLSRPPRWLLLFVDMLICGPC